jgi:hypothetical protein
MAGAVVELPAQGENMWSKRVGVLLGTFMCAGAAWGQLAWESMQMSQVKVSFPETPRYKMSSESTPVGPITSQNYIYAGQNYTLTANSAKLPSMVLSFRGAEALYGEAAKALLKEHGGAQQLSYQPLTLLGYPAAELRFRSKSGEEGRARFVLLHETLYTTQATWTGSPPALVDKFFDSMKLK